MRVVLLILVLVCRLSIAQTFYSTLADSAANLEDRSIVYDPSYFSIIYPAGDVPENIGVCTDVVIRAYRKVGIDLQKEVHEDMQGAFNQYPNFWGNSSTDKNIDHRRVPNLMKYFERNGRTLSISNDGNNYQPGDIVCWNLGGNTTHIGIIINQLSGDSQRHLVIHNIGGGQAIEDILFDFKIIGHYRYPSFY